MIEIITALTIGWAPFVITLCVLILLMILIPEKDND